MHRRQGVNSKCGFVGAFGIDNDHIFTLGDDECRNALLNIALEITEPHLLDVHRLKLQHYADRILVSGKVSKHVFHGECRQFFGGHPPASATEKITHTA